MLGAIASRIEAAVPELARRVEGASAYTALIRANKFPASSVAAYVIPTGLRGGEADASAGLFTQMYASTVMVVIFLRSTDATGKAALDRLDAMLMDVVRAVAGWAPGGEVGVFRLNWGRLIDSSAGRLAYQLEFSIDDQLEVT